MFSAETPTRFVADSSRQLVVALLDDLACAFFSSSMTKKRSPGGRDLGEAEDLDRDAGARFLDGLSTVGEQHAGLAEAAPAEDVVAALERAVLDEDRRDDATPFGLLRLEDGALGRPVRDWP